MISKLLTILLSTLITLSAFTQTQPTAEELDNAMSNAKTIEGKMDQMIEAGIDARFIFPTSIATLSGIAAFVGTYFYTQRQQQRQFEKYFAEKLLQKHLSDYLNSLKDIRPNVEAAIEKAKKILRLIEENESVFSSMEAFLKANGKMHSFPLKSDIALFDTKLLAELSEIEGDPRMPEELKYLREQFQSVGKSYQALLISQGNYSTGIMIPKKGNLLYDLHLTSGKSIEEAIRLDQKIFEMYEDGLRRLSTSIWESKNPMPAGQGYFVSKEYLPFHGESYTSGCYLGEAGTTTKLFMPEKGSSEYIETYKRLKLNLEELLEKHEGGAFLASLESGMQKASQLILESMKRTTKYSFMTSVEMRNLINDLIKRHTVIINDILPRGEEIHFNENTPLNRISQFRLSPLKEIKFQAKGNLKAAALIAAGAVIVTAGAYVVSEIFSSPEEEDATKNLSDAFINGDAATRRAILVKNPEAIQYLQEIRDALL